MKVIKRSGEEVYFDKERIVIAIQKAMADTNGDSNLHYDLEEETFPYEIAEDIEEILENREKITVENIQDLVEISLMREAPLVAKNYILYRDKRNQERKARWQLTEMQQAILDNKYLQDGENFEEFLNRVSNGNEQVMESIRKKKYIFAGRIIAGRGLHKKGKKVTLSNCFVLPPVEDNIESIFETAKQMARTYSWGGGVGVDLSGLRPRGAEVNNSAKQTTGAVSFMDLYSLTTSLIGQSGRRGALMLSIDVNHPDLEEFINVKTELGKVEFANISIKVDNKFMEAVRDNKEYNLEFVAETGETITKTIDARRVFRKLAANNWDWAEPGMIYWDKIENWHFMSENPEFKYVGLNPCAEEPLPAYGSCNLSSINLSYFIKKVNGKHIFDFDAFGDTVEELTVALNDILDESIENNLYPLQEQAQAVIDWRQIGIGIMGWADLLIKLGIKYGSDESVRLAEQIGFMMLNSSVRQSALLAKDLGTYGKYDYETLSKSEFFKQNLTQLNKDIIKKFGLRNSQFLTIAPTGSISTLLGISGGVEPIFMNSYNRLIKSFDGDKKYKVYTPIVKEYMEEHGITKEEDLPEFFVTAMTLDYKERIKMQSAWQKYIDASISSTVNVPSDFLVEDVEDLYLRAWEAGLKGITLFRDNSKRAGILTGETKKPEKEVEPVKVVEVTDEKEESEPIDPTECST